MKNPGLLFLIAVFVAGCKGPRFDPREPEPFTGITLTNEIDRAWLTPPSEPYRLGPGDAITVETLGEGASAANLIVGPDGKIYYSLLPGISVWGLTLTETQQLLQAEMARFTRIKPNLVLNLRQVGSRRVWMLGGGGNAVYALNAPATLLEAISAAGGAGTFEGTTDDVADLTRSFVMRNGRRIPVNFERLLREGDLRQNIYLEPDDFIYMPLANQAGVYVIGAVATPGIVPWNRNLSLVEALATAGSTIKYSHTTRIVLIRGGLSQPRLAEIDFNAIRKGRAPDVSLRPGDIVYVPYVPGRHLLKLAEEALDQFVRTLAVNEGIYVGTGQEQPVQLTAPFGTLSPP